MQVKSRALALAPAASVSFRSLASLFFLALALLIATPLRAATLSLEGGLPRDAGQGYFDLAVTIKGIDTELELKTKGALDADTFVDRFEIQLSDVDSHNVPFSSLGVTANLKFFATLAQQPAPEELGTNVAGTTDLRYHIRIQESDAGELERQLNENKLKKISITFKLGGEVLVPKTDFTLARDSFVVTEAPAFAATAVIGSHSSLTVNWQRKDSVKVLNFDAEAQRAPSSVTIFVVRNDQVSGTLSLPAKVYKATATDNTPDADTSCEFTLPASDAASACVSCAEAKTYLNRSAIAKMGGFIVTTVPASAESKVITSLANDQNYTVFMQYEPDGIERSVCLRGVPSANFTLTELNGEGEAKYVDFRCFIATAAYGTPLHADIDRFRAFRDEVLAKAIFGSYLIKAYYRLSPPLADFIAEHETVRRYVHAALTQLASCLPRAKPLATQAPHHL